MTEPPIPSGIPDAQPAVSGRGPAGRLARVVSACAVALAMVVCLCASHGARAQLLSPGDLARVHADLGSDTDCTRCHTGGRGVEVSLCVDCHADIGDQRQRGRGLHGTRFKREECGHCHVEHRGKSHELIRWPGGSQKGFDHPMTGFALRGAHAKAECKDCHDRKNPRGARTFLGTPNTCHACHANEDVHKGRFGKRCNDCHGESRWPGADLERVNHDLTRFPLLGKHQKVECKNCHEEPPRYRDMAFQTCGSCHEDPHAGRLGARCADCHKESGWADVTMARSAHPGLRIGGGHTKVACRDCHDQGLLRPPTTGARCVDCHRPVHEARFGKRCERCHRGIQWLGLADRVGRKVHDLTAFPLEGQHGPVACDACHRPSLPVAERYRGLSFAQCRNCHQDVHGGRLSRFGDGDCTSCHDVHGFAPTLFTVEQHVHAAFPLVGRHVAVACSSCHRAEPPRLDWTLEKKVCADCHDNPHGEQFAREMAQGGCASCHSPVAWNVPNIDHSTWPLTGAHELVACAACHDATEADRRAGTGASYRGAPRVCEGCHTDVHLGQFRLNEPVRACDFCHTTTQFPIAPFDHTRLAGYALDGKHVEVACEGCHGREVLSGGHEAIRYRLGYRGCRDCHADPHADRPAAPQAQPPQAGGAR